MSGAKRTYVSVEDRELRRLREQDSRLRQVQTDLPERLEAVRRQAAEEMQGRLRPMEDRQRRQEQMIGSLESDLSALERDTQRRLNRQHREFMAHLHGQRGEYLSMFREHDRKFTGMIDAERRDRQRAVADLQGQINSIVADAGRKQNAAGAFVADLSRIMKEVETLPHDRFAPGRMADIRRHVSDARRSVNAGMPEAALSTAQSAFWELADLRALTQAREAEFTLLYQAALEEARALLEEARSHRQYKMEMGREGEEDPIELEVDHWSHGALSVHMDKIRAIESRLLAEADALSIDEARSLLAQLNALRAELPEIVERARCNILASQNRADIADMAIEAFRLQGYALVGETYEGADQRNAYVIKMKNIANSEVVTVIRPVEGQMGKNEVSVHSWDETFVDDATLRQRAEEFVALLRDEGLDAETPRCAGDAAPEYRKIEDVGKPRPERVRAPQGARP